MSSDNQDRVARETSAPVGSNAIAALSHVPVATTVRLAHKQMRLEDLVSLQRGDVVTFDSSVTAPVELVAAGRVIATGELVSVDDRMGIRILQVAPAEQPDEASGT